MKTCTKCGIEKNESEFSKHSIMKDALVRQKKCKGCGIKFQPVRPLQAACSIPCAIAVANAKRKKAGAKELKAAKEKIKTRAQWLKEAQAEVNKYIRLRDHDQPCISCGRYHDGQWHAGHYRSVGACPELRFDERNIFKQCAPCNNHLSGNIIEYRIGLIKRVGVPAVEWLEGKHDPKKYTIEDIKLIKADFAKRARELSR